MDLSKFNDSLMYSNKNVEKLAKKLINESTNAVLMEMFEDKCILADHITGQIFEAVYNFDGKTFEFKNFAEVRLEQDKSSLREAIGNYFDDENVNLAEEYERCSTSTSDMFEASLTEALASKNMENVINYSELVGINEEVSSLKKTDFFKAYKERLSTHPTESIKMFNWKDPVKVSLIDEDYHAVINKSSIAKAKKLKSDANFKKDLNEAAAEALGGDTSLLEDLVYANSSILALDKAGMKELVGISVVGNRQLMEHRNDVVDMINSIISENPELSEKQTYLLEAEEGAEEVKTDAAPEVSDEGIDELKKALEKAKGKISDTKLTSKIESLISDLSDSSEAGETDVQAVKEAVELLSL